MTKPAGLPEIADSYRNLVACCTLHINDDSGHMKDLQAFIRTMSRAELQLFALAATSSLCRTNERHLPDGWTLNDWVRMYGIQLEHITQDWK